MTDLPIEAVLPALRAALAAHTSVVLEAPPGAGKTTRVPLALLDEPWLGGRRIVMLEPRRLAARAAARRMAALLGERVGETVGYRVRLDTRVGPATRIEVVTEGVLTRILQADPALEGVGLVIFDEFHERSLHADLGLALTLQARELLREELRVLVMSATLDGAAVAALLGGGAGVEKGGSAGEPAREVAVAAEGRPETEREGEFSKAAAGEFAKAPPEAPVGKPAEKPVGEPARCAVPVVRAEGRAFPVETRYLGRARHEAVERAAVRAVVRALEDVAAGDVLVFLPGVAEIRRAEALLGEAGLPPGVRVAPLYGDLPEEAQERAVAPAAPGERKVVLATSIAETSLTIEGVRVVVDSGVMRVPRFSPRTGMTRLETVTVSRASAEQRRGRAGRLGPGVCYRLWTEAEDRQLAPHRRPEILEADLAPLALELAVWGVADPGELRWLDPPPAAAFAQARELLAALGALDGAGGATEEGRRMARLGLHPRLAHMVLRGAELGHGAVACDAAALLGGRDILRRDDGPADADLRLRLEVLAEARRRGRPPRTWRGHAVHAGGCGRALREAAHWRGALGIREVAGDVEACGVLLGLAYPDRIGRRRPGGVGRFLLCNGRGATLPESEPLAHAEWIVAAELNDVGRDGRILLAAPLDAGDVVAHFGDRVEREESIAWDAETRAVRARRRERIGAVVLREAPLEAPDADAVAAALLGGVRAEGLGLLPWTPAAVRVRERLRFLHRLDGAGPDVSDEALLASLEEWLGPHVQGMTRADELGRLDLAAILLGSLPWDRRRRLDAWAPDRIEVPSGSRIPIDYSDPAAPALDVRLQEVFGWTETPRIADGRVPLTLRLLSPARRPVQVTRDLASFWRTTYFDVKKDLKGRYPKHYWPDDPLRATPTRHARPRG
ncbi:MAG TPA: ATP-dependent helicase HrpB [Longimicrobiales bacterium]